MRKTVFYEEHLGAGAKMVEFAGWTLPLQYEGISREHLWCRQNCAFFDTSHMPVFSVRGPGVSGGLGYLLTTDPARLPAGRCRYTFMLNEKGGVIDDLIVYAVGKNDCLLVGNAAGREKVYERLVSSLGPEKVRDLSGETVKIDVQGPLSDRVLKESLGINTAGIRFFGFSTFRVDGSEWLVSRTGYTGEKGYELYLPAGSGPETWRRLSGEPRAKPAGLGARDTLRLEMALPLCGQEIDEEITPLEAGLESFVDMEHQFIGREALSTEKPVRRARALLSPGRRAPRRGQTVFVGDEPAGQVTSGSFSPSLERGIGLALVNARATSRETVHIGREKAEFECRIMEKSALPALVRERKKGSPRENR